MSTTKTLRTPLAQVRGRGAARSGANTWIAERVSSVALALLSPWFIWAAASTLTGGYEATLAWVRQPWNAVAFALFMAVSFHHMQLGMRVIIEDYIHKHGTKTVLLLANLFLCTGLTAASVFAILKVSLGA